MSPSAAFWQRRRTEIAEEGGNRYFVLAGKNLWEITGTPRTEEEIAPELATPTPTEALCRMDRR